MNPLTRDFLHRWRWLLLGQFIATAGLWIGHATRPELRLSFQMIVGVAMSWDLMRGSVRIHLRLPMSRAELASGLWCSVVLVSTAIQCAGLLAGAAIAAALGQPVLTSTLPVHLVLAILLGGTIQFLLTGVPSQPAQNIGDKIRGAFFGGLWGLSLWGFAFAGYFAPVSWSALQPGFGIIMAVMAALTVVSWFNTRAMVDGRAQGNPQLAAAAGTRAERVDFAPRSAWRAWVVQELIFQKYVSLIAFLFALLQAGIGLYTRRLTSGPPQDWTVQLCMICGMSIIPLMGVQASVLRVQRALPVSLSSLALASMARVCAIVLNITGCLLIVSFLTGGGSFLHGRIPAILVLAAGYLCVGQALLIRWTRLPVGIAVAAMLAPLGIFTSSTPGLPQVPPAALVATGLLLLPIAWLMHCRWLRTSASIYRQPAWLARFSGSQQR